MCVIWFYIRTDCSALPWVNAAPLCELLPKRHNNSHRAPAVVWQLTQRASSVLIANACTFSPWLHSKLQFYQPPIWPWLQQPYVYDCLQQLQVQLPVRQMHRPYSWRSIKQQVRRLHRPDSRRQIKHPILFPLQWMHQPDCRRPIKQSVQRMHQFDSCLKWSEYDAQILLYLKFCCSS